VAYACGSGEAFDVLMTGFDGHGRCLLPVGKFHHDDHEVLRVRE
jgi:hypothetical protein